MTTLEKARHLLDAAGYTQQQVGGIVYHKEEDGRLRYATTSKRYASTPSLPALAGGSVDIILVREDAGEWQSYNAPLNKPDRLVAFAIEHTSKNAVREWLQSIGFADDLITALTAEDATLSTPQIQELDSQRRMGFDAQCIAFLLTHFPNSKTAVYHDVGLPINQQNLGLETGETALLIEDWLTAAVRETWEEAGVAKHLLWSILKTAPCQTVDISLHSRRSIEHQLAPTDVRLVLLPASISIDEAQSNRLPTVENSPPAHEETPSSLTLKTWHDAVINAIQAQGITPKTMAAINRFNHVFAIAEKLGDAAIQLDNITPVQADNHITTSSLQTHLQLKPIAPRHITTA